MQRRSNAKVFARRCTRGGAVNRTTAAGRNGTCERGRRRETGNVPIAPLVSRWLRPPRTRPDSLRGRSGRFPRGCPRPFHRRGDAVEDSRNAGGTPVSPPPRGGIPALGALRLLRRGRRQGGGCPPVRAGCSGNRRRGGPGRG